MRAPARSLNSFLLGGRSCENIRHRDGDDERSVSEPLDPSSPLFPSPRRHAINSAGSQRYHGSMNFVLRIRGDPDYMKHVWNELA